MISFKSPDLFFFMYLSLALSEVILGSIHIQSENMDVRRGWAMSTTEQSGALPEILFTKNEKKKQ